MSQNIKWFNEIGIEDVAKVGGKNASLGEMYRNLTSEGVRVPNGFAVTADAYVEILDANSAWDKLHEQLDNLDVNDVDALQSAGKKCREIVYNAKLPDDLRADILNAYEKLKEEYGERAFLLPCAHQLLPKILLKLHLPDKMIPI